MRSIVSRRVLVILILWCTMGTVGFTAEPSPPDAIFAVWAEASTDYPPANWQIPVTYLVGEVGSASSFF